jgi:hypothetical protein
MLVLDRTKVGNLGQKSIFKCTKTRILPISIEDELQTEEEVQFVLIH